MDDGVKHFFNDLQDFDVQMSHIFNSSPLKLKKYDNGIIAENVGNNSGISIGINSSYLSGVDNRPNHKLKDNEIRLFSGETSMYNYTSGKRQKKKKI